MVISRDQAVGGSQGVCLGMGYSRVAPVAWTVMAHGLTTHHRVGRHSWVEWEVWRGAPKRQRWFKRLGPRLAGPTSSGLG